MSQTRGVLFYDFICTFEYNPGILKYAEFMLVGYAATLQVAS
jgi:hypothetical protein